MMRQLRSSLIGLVVLGAILAGCSQQPREPGRPQGAILPGNAPSLAVEKIEPATALPGQSFPGEIRVVNQGDEPLFDVTVILVVPPGLEMLGAAPNPSRVTAQGQEWRIATLGPREGFIVQLALRGQAGEFQSKVIVRGNRRVEAEATGLVTVSALPGLTTSLTDDPGVARVGDTIAYRISLTGQGYGEAREVTVELHIPTGMRLATEAPPEATLDGRVLRFAPFTLAVGTVRELRVQLIAEEAGDWVVRAVVGYQGFQHRIVVEEGTHVYGG